MLIRTKHLELTLRSYNRLDYGHLFVGFHIQLFKHSLTTLRITLVVVPCFPFTLEIDIERLGK
jgi:hypothetical protein